MNYTAEMYGDTINLKPARKSFKKSIDKWNEQAREKNSRLEKYAVIAYSEPTRSPKPLKWNKVMEVKTKPFKW